MGDGSYHSSRHNSDESDSYAGRRLFGNKEAGVTMRTDRVPPGSNMSGYNSSAASRSGSQPPSRGDLDYSSRQRADPRQFQYNRGVPTNAGVSRSNVSANAPPFVTQISGLSHSRPDQVGSGQIDHLTSYIDRLQMTREDMSSEFDPSPSYDHRSQPMIGLAQERSIPENWQTEEGVFQPRQDPLSPTGSGSGSLGSTSNAVRNPTYPPHFSHSPNNSDTRLSHQSPFYPTGGTPPYQQNVTSRGHYNGVGQAALLERKLQGLQEQQQQQLHPRHGHGYRQPNPLQFSGQMPNPYEVHTPNALRMNPLGSYYNMPPPHLLGSHIPRGPAREMDVGQQVRSPLLEEFRNNSKTNKRYELKVSRAAIH